MQKNAQIRIYSSCIYLFKASTINSRTRCEISSKLTNISKRPHWHENIQKHWWCSDAFTVNFEQIPHLFLVFHSWIWESAAGWVYRWQSKGRGVNIMKNARAATSYATLTKRVKLQYEKKLVSNLKSIKSKALRKYLWNVLRFSFHKYFFVENKIVLEASSVAVTDNSSVHCFDQLYNKSCFTRFETSHIIKKIGRFASHYQ